LGQIWPKFGPNLAQISKCLFRSRNSPSSAARRLAHLCGANPRGQRALHPTKVCAKQPEDTRDIALKIWRIFNFGQIRAQNCNFCKVPKDVRWLAGGQKTTATTPARAPGTAEPKKSAFEKWPPKDCPWVAFFRQAICKLSFSLPLPLFPL